MKLFSLYHPCLERAPFTEQPVRGFPISSLYDVQRFVPGTLNVSQMFQCVILVANKQVNSGVKRQAFVAELPQRRQIDCFRGAAGPSERELVFAQRKLNRKPRFPQVRLFRNRSSSGMVRDSEGFDRK